MADEVCKKLILRHPHVFGNVQADTVDKVLTNWDAIKKDEKRQETYTDTLKSVPKVFPSLMRAQKLGKRASRAGVDFESKAQLLSNALKYTGQGGTVQIYREGDDLCIRDSGMGIAPEDLPRVFDMGYTGQNGRLDRRSSGIGLYLCRRICRNLRHEIRIESAPGVGTTVRLTLGRGDFLPE